ncbi:MAG: dihydropteroate synthase-like enzyme [Candidatus Atelocyanobacterium thalassa isolate SIO64986]|uniref:Dihydropteroate synthase-like enzyme n=1 Tax=Candidatus Atelocyanobacterium thalassa isolate SIO64986 TaxID=1527444 RepID=A0A086CGK0_9CHRO|nr:MAG: dihydropteroate synthase-like enzyme [Candidatus Atelocyanobacterium thalassa isolate SIO64986]
MKTIKQLDEKLSKRYISLDPKGYFIIYIDRNQNLICAKYFTNIINDKGLAVDPENGEVISVRNKVTRSANQIFTGRSAKELCIKIIENNDNCLITMLDHAAYLGREFMKAEIALMQEIEYIQD